MDTDGETFEQQVLAYEARQTTALEALRNFALIVLVLMAVGIVIGLVVAFS